MSQSLSVYTGRGQTLDVALQIFVKTLPAQGAIALLYAPGECRFARLTGDGQLRDSAGRIVELSPVYEARVFHAEAELRWLNDPGVERNHRCVVLSERLYALDLKLTPLPVADTLQPTYLLWGVGVGTAGGLADGWSRLATPRIGKLDVPVAGAGPGDRVVLHAREYLAEYEDGNLAVAEERLVELEVNRG